MLDSTATFGKFEFRPLEPGYAMTVGNALRRVLLSSLEGYAITTVKVAGVDHEFAAVPGVMEGMIDIILKLKQIRFIRTVENQDAEKASINIAGVTEYSKVDLQPSVEQMSIFHEKDLAFMTENDGGVVTVFCVGQKPTNDYTVQVTISEVSENG